MGSYGVSLERCQGGRNVTHLAYAAPPACGGLAEHGRCVSNILNERMKDAIPCQQIMPTF